jgi:broad-specificity NMP kinase
MTCRGFKGGKLWENLAAEILDVCLWEALCTYGPDKVCEIDVTGKGVEYIVEMMLTIIEGSRPCEVGSVDWLGKFEDEGNLEEFFRVF